MGWMDEVETRAAARYREERRPTAVKAFSMPPFWASDGARVQLLAASVSPDGEGGGDTYERYAANLYKGNGVIFACAAARARVFSQVRFAYQKMTKGRPGELFGTPDLSILEVPWANATTADLTARMEVDASLAGNFFATTVDSTGRVGRAARKDDAPFVARMAPQHCTLIIRAPSGNPNNIDARVVGLAYHAPGMDKKLILTNNEFIHYAPMPDPQARWRGMSWMTPVVREAAADDAFTNHKIAFLTNGATPNLVVKMSEDVEEEEFLQFVAQFKEDYEGARNAYKTLFLAGGADVTPLTVDFQSLDVRGGQGSLETRMASAAGVPPAIAGLSEGLQGSALNAGNFQATRRLFVDSTQRDLWGRAAPSLAPLAPPPGGTRMWYDDRDIPFLRDDVKDEAETFQLQATAARTLTDAGWDPDAVIAAAKARDIGLLAGKHSGLFSVQLQPRSAADPLAIGQSPPAGSSTQDMPALEAAGRNGNGR